MLDCRHSDSANSTLRFDIAAAHSPPFTGSNTRPVLKLKPKAGPVVAASVIRKEPRP